WNEHLLHEPPGTEARKRFQQLQPTVRSRLIAELACCRGFSEDNAEELFSLLVNGGIRDAIAWRCNISRYDLGIVRIRRLLSDLMAGFPTWAQERIEQFVSSLWRAMCDS